MEQPAPSHSAETRQPKPKKRPKKLKDKNGGAKKSTAAKSDHKVLALAYLRCWHENRDQWKFHKNHQTWLLNSIFDKTQLSKEDFTILLSYMEKLQGKAHERVVDKAQQIIGDEANAGSTMQKRAQKVLKMFAPIL